MFSLSDVIVISCIASAVVSFVVLVLMSTLVVGGTEERCERAYKQGYMKGREEGKMICPFSSGKGKECNVWCKYYHTCTRSEYQKEESTEYGRCKVDKNND